MCAHGVPSAAAQHSGDSDHIVDPCLIALLRKIVEIEFETPGKLLRLQYELAISARRNSSVRRKADCGRHHEAIVVVGVFADEVDASGGSKDARTSSVNSFKLRYEFEEVHAPGVFAAARLLYEKRA